MKEFYKTTSVIGFSKDAGKTTLFNYLIQKNNEKKVKLGLLSIGVDGEETDLLSGRQKPKIIVPEGSLVATTSSGLKAGTGKWRILEKISHSSSLGDVYIAEATETGSVKLLGTISMDDVSYVLSLFDKYGSQKGMVDGAYDRLASASPFLIDEAYLVIGASLHANEPIFWKTVEQKLHSFFYPRADEENTFGLKKENLKNQVIIQSNKGLEFYPSTILHINDEILEKEMDWIFIPGVLTNQMLSKMLKHKRAWTIVLQHNLKSFVSLELVERWKKNGGRIEVLHSIPIKGIAYNPFSPEGYSYSALRMEEKINQLIQKWTNDRIPVFDIWHDQMKGEIESE